jgi:phosphotriesterase-related protein
MATVETVQGAVDVDQLGTVLVHEHVRFRDEATADQWPGRYDEQAELAAALESVAAALDRGVRTICDPTAMFGGRDVRFIRRVAAESGAQILACTGIYTYDHLPLYFENRDADEIAEHFVADIEQGIQGTEIKAAFLKCAADAPGITDNVEKIHRAVARASVRTGAPIMAHSRPASATGPDQVAIFEDEGVDLSRVQIAHTGDTDDLDYIQRLLDKGVFIGMDRYGIEMYLPMQRRNATVAELLRRGHAGQMLISQDYCATLDWFTPQAMEAMDQRGAVHDWSMTLVFDQVLPALREEGALTDEHQHTIFVDNPRRWLSG